MNYEEFKTLSVGQLIARTDEPELDYNIISKIDHGGYYIYVAEGLAFGDIILIQETDREIWTVDSPTSIAEFAEELVGDLCQSTVNKSEEVQKEIFAKVVAGWIDELYSKDEYDSAINAIQTELNNKDEEE